MSHVILLLFGAMFLTNAIPHLGNGLSGRAFPSPFAKPMGQGLSSPVTNILWGMANLTAAWGLLVHWGQVDLSAPMDALSVGLAMLGTGLGLAAAFGRLNGGETP